MASTKLELKKETVQKILDLKVKIRGNDLKLLKEYIIEERGTEGWEKIKKAMENIGRPITPQDFSLQFSPLGVRILLFLVAKKVLGWDNKKLEDCGRTLVKRARIIKFFSPIFRINREFLFKKLPRIIQKYIRNLEIKPLRADLENNYCVIRVGRLKPLPLQAEQAGLAYFKGIFTGWAEMVVGKEVSSCLEKKDKYYRFILSW